MLLHYYKNRSAITAHINNIIAVFNSMYLDFIIILLLQQVGLN